MEQLFTSESVSTGHPDKLADQISDAILDALLKEDVRLQSSGDLPEGRSCRGAIETLLTRGTAVVAGEIRSEGYVDIPKIVRSTITNAGYTNTELGFDGNTCGVLVAVQAQSDDIAAGVDTGGAGDQGMMFGMAVRETDVLMPLPITIAHALTRRAVEVRQSKPDLRLRPDVKSQVSVLYDAENRPRKIDTIVLSQQHHPESSDIKEIVQAEIIEPVLAEFAEYRDGDPTLHINPTGIFTEGGPQGDTGLTGRKIIVDTYGGMCPHGGGAFSGKDPTKVDRSAAYMARHIAKCVVAAELADRVVIQLAYAIGVADPVSIHLDTSGTEKVDRSKIVKAIREVFDMTPAGIIRHFDLRRPIYLPTSQNGHFGNPSFPWERTDEATALAAQV